MRKTKFVLFLLLLSQVGFSQFLGRVTYRTKVVYNITFKKDSTTKSYTLDTISYSVPFEVLFTTKSVAIDGYGTFPVVQYYRNGNFDAWFHHYILKGGTFVTIGQKVMYLVYPISNLKQRTVMFDIQQDIP